MVKLSVDLFPEEVLLLSSIKRPEVAALVEQAQLGLSLPLPPSQSQMVARVVARGKEKGSLGFCHKQVTSCPCCLRQSSGYYKFKSTTRYHRKGEDDRSKPIQFLAFDLSDNFFSFKNHVSIGFCNDCRQVVEPYIFRLLEKEKVIWSKHWKNAPTNIWERQPICQCTKCSWRGPKWDLLPLPAVMSGYYPGECPECHAKNIFLGPINIETTSEIVWRKLDAGPLRIPSQHRNQAPSPRE